MKWLQAGSAALVVLALAGCKSFDGLTDLEVINENDADRARVLQTWADNEAFIFGSFNAIYWGVQPYYPSLESSTMADETTFSWGNYDSRVLSSEPRSAYNNSPSYTYEGHGEWPWYNVYEGLSNVYDGLRAVNEDTTGQACIEVDCDRLFAYGKLMQGFGHGFLALNFDSAFVLDETIDLFDENGDAVDQPFVPYQVMWDSAASYMGEVRNLTSGVTWDEGIPNGMLGKSGNRFNAAEVSAFASSFLVQRWPHLARTPQERDMLPWNLILAEVPRAMAVDIFLEGDGGDLWLNRFLSWNHGIGSTTWARADYKTIGAYDVNSLAGNGIYGYVDWLNENTPARNEFKMVRHPDARIMDPADADGTTSGTDFFYRGSSRFPSSRGTYHYSFYMAQKYKDYGATRLGPMPWIMRVHVDLTGAEAELRLTGVSTTVTDIIDATRVNRGGLPSITANGTPSFDVAMDAIIYERRIEDFSTCSGCAYYNRRGEGALANTQGYVGNDPAGIPGGFDMNGNPIQNHRGLVEGTPLHTAPPGAELEVLVLPIYTYGGVGQEGPTNASRAPTSAASYDRAVAGRHSISAFYIPVEESFRRKAERRALGKDMLVRYVR